MDTRRQRALAWLVASQQADGSWPDFIVSPTTQGREWTTGYVATLLAGVPRCRIGSGGAALERAWEFLDAHRHRGGGWGFWASSPVDADSTAWCVRALLAGGRSPSSLCAELELLERHLLHGGADGGSATYHRSNIDELPEHSGYYQATACVTATVGLALHEAGALAKPTLDSCARWLAGDRLADHSWRSFWWDAGIYATAMVVRLWRRAQVPTLEPKRVRDFFLDRQDEDGSWSSQPHEGRSSFDTAMSVQALLELGIEPTQAPIRRALEWLLDAQRDDGSWSCVPIMRVPDPNLPWDPNRPSGVVIPSHRRTFVTATVLATLHRIPCARPRFVSSQPRLSLGRWAAEVDDVVTRFDAWVDALPTALRRQARRTPAWHRRGAGLSHVLPFWLNARFADGRLLDEARAMALANRFGQVYCLLRDGIIDGDDDSEVSILLVLDALFLAFVRGYQRLLPTHARFWAGFERCWLEYLDALARERAFTLQTSFDERQLEILAHKFSPVKICVLAMAELADAREQVPALERMIESIQLGVQLLDDLEDAVEDAKHGRITWPLALVREASKVAADPKDVERWLWARGCAAPVLDRALLCFASARELALTLALDELAQWCEALEREARAARARASSHRPSRALDLHRDLHQDLYRIGASSGPLVYDASSLGLFALEGGDSEEEDLDALAEALVRPPPPALPKQGLRTLILGAHATSPHRCASCPVTQDASFESTCPSSLGEATELARELIVGTDGLAHLVLLDPGQAPGWTATRELVGEARARARELGRPLSLHLVLQPQRVDAEAVAAIEELAARVSIHADAVSTRVQIDRLVEALTRLRGVDRRGPSTSVHLRDYQGDPALVVERLAAAGAIAIDVDPRRSAPGRRLDPAMTLQDVEILIELFMSRLATDQPLLMPALVATLRRILKRERRALHCSAGDGVLALGRDGHRYPCHVLARHRALVVTDPRPWRISVDQREPCRSCRVRYLCGGGCRAGHLEQRGSIGDPDPDECALIIGRCEALMRRVPELDERARRWICEVELDAIPGLELG